jgi:nanoRNase/pAp phosphatase (c-di-AMP/oligoRNAs hydrolase)
MGQAILVAESQREDFEQRYDLDALEDIEQYSIDDEDPSELDDDVLEHESLFAYGVDDTVLDHLGDNGIPCLTEDDLQSEYTDALRERLEEIHYRQKAEKLDETIADRDNWAVLLHDNPDPDAMSAAYAFQQIADRYDTDAKVYHLGEINHQQNKAMVNQLDIKLERQIPDLDDHDGIALLDTNPTSTHIINTNGGKVIGDNTDQEPYQEDDIDIDVLIDHHGSWDGIEDYRKRDGEEAFIDIREERGCTASRMTDYLRLLNIEPTDEVATSLLMGVMTDTDRLDPEQNFIQQDIEAVPYLYERVDDRDRLSTIWESPISPEFAEVQAKGILNREKDGSVCYSYLGHVKEPNAVPSAADILLELEGVETAVAYGKEETDDGKEQIRISGRNKNIKINLGEALKNRFGGGGESLEAGAQVPIDEEHFQGIADKYYNADTAERQDIYLDAILESIKQDLEDLDRETS